MFLSLLACYALSYSYECTNSNCGSMNDGEEFVVDAASSTYEGYYCGCDSGKSVPVKITAASVPNNYFYENRDITKVTLDGTTSIGDGAFSGCSNLKTITFSDVTSIGESAFESCSQLGAITLPAKLSTIGDSAFQYCSNIKINSITFTGTSIGSYAFGYLSGVTGTLNLHPASGSTLTVGEGAFCYTGITGLSIREGLTSIPLKCFQGTSTLEGEVNFPQSLTSIGECSFERTKITSIVFAQGNDQELTTIDTKAFYNTPLDKVKSIQFPSTLETIGASAFEDSQFSGTITLGDSLERINEKAFFNVAGLTLITTDSTKGNVFPSTLEYIGDYAFDNTGLAGAISFKDAHLKYIGKYAFEGLSITGSLEIQLRPQDTGEDGVIKDHAFLNSGINEDIKISDGTIEEYAFERLNFASLETDGCTINGYAFVKCIITSGMKFIDTTIETDAFIKGQYTNRQASDVLFYGGNVEGLAFNSFSISDSTTINLTDVEIGPKGFETLIGKPSVVFDHDDDEHKDRTYNIGERAFYNTEIQGINNGNLEIPEAYDEIGSYAFAFCKGLTKDLIVNSSRINDFAFYYSGFTGTLQLDTNVEHLTSADKTNPSVDQSGDANTFSGCRFRTLWLNNTGSIPDRCFYKMDSVEGTLYFPETVASIGEESFYGLYKVTRLEFEKNPQKSLSLSQGSFAKCSGIANHIEFERDIGDGDSFIQPYLFYQCTSLPSITFPKELKVIDDYSFYECTSLGSLTLPYELEKIGKYAFYRCTGLTKDLQIPPLIHGEEDYGVKSLGSHAFHGCTSFDGKLGISHLTTIPEYAFYGCKFTGELDISKATKIEDYAFYGCDGFAESLLLYEDMPRYVQIKDHAFHGCTQLKGPINTARVSLLGEGCFHNCNELTGTLNLDSLSNNEIPDYAFYECRSLNGTIIWPSSLTSIGDYSFYGCTGLNGDLNLPDTVKDFGEYAFAGCSHLTGPLKLDSVQHIQQHAFDGCSGLSGSLVIPKSFAEIERYAFNGCTGFSGSLNIDVSNTAGTDSSGHDIPKKATIRDHAFNDCSGFKDGKLYIYIDNEEEEYNIGTYTISPYYRYKYFLRIENEAFEGTKFKNVYYNGRFQPDCDYDIGISQIKGIHTSSNYANKTFCGNPIHKSKLSGGAIAGIVIACIVVVAAIVILIVFLIIRNRKNKDHSEGEVEMNGDP